MDFDLSFYVSDMPDNNFVVFGWLSVISVKDTAMLSLMRKALAITTSDGQKLKGNNQHTKCTVWFQLYQSLMPGGRKIQVTYNTK